MCGVGLGGGAGEEVGGEEDGNEEEGEGSACHVGVSRGRVLFCLGGAAGVGRGGRPKKRRAPERGARSFGEMWGGVNLGWVGVEGGLAGGEVEGVADVGAAAVAGGGELPGADAGLEAGGDGGAAHFVGGDLDGADVAGAKDSPFHGNFAFEVGIFEEFFVVALGDFCFLLVDDALDNLFVEARGLDVATGEGGFGGGGGFFGKVGAGGAGAVFAARDARAAGAAVHAAVDAAGATAVDAEAARVGGGEAAGCAVGVGAIEALGEVGDAFGAAAEFGDGHKFLCVLGDADGADALFSGGAGGGLTVGGVGVLGRAGAGVGGGLGRFIIGGWGFIDVLGDDFVDHDIGVFDAGEFGLGGG